MSVWVVFVGSGLGGLARWWLAGWIGGKTGPAFPWGTLVVNVTGSLLIGLFAGLTAPEARFAAPVWVRQLVMVGFFGGYTTFSAFSYQTLELAHLGQWGRAGANVILSVGLSLAAVALGHALAGPWASARGPG